MREISLVAFDLDGTLLDSSKRIPASAKSAVTRLREAGVFITVVTGRGYHSARQYIEELRLQIPFGLYHGALVRDTLGIEVLKRAIPKVGVREAIDLASSLDCVPMVIPLETETGLIFRREDEGHPIVRFVIESERSEVSAGGQNISFIPHEELRADAFLVYVMGLKERIRKFLDTVRGLPVPLYQAELFPVYAPRASAELRETHAVAMLSPIGADKRTALTAITDSLGVPLENVMAFGDWHNDIPMLEASGTAVLMGNAPPAVAQRLRHPNLYRTGANDGAGIADALARFGLI